MLPDLGEITSDESYAVRRNELAFWEPWARHGLKSLGLPQPAVFRSPGKSTNPVLIGDNGLVVKLYSEYWYGPSSLGSESEAYEVLSGQGLPVPELLGRGELLPGATGWTWPFLVLSTVTGRPWWEVTEGAGRATGLALARQVGELLGRLRHVPLTGPRILSPTSPVFGDLLRERRAATVSDHRTWGHLPPHLVDAIDDFLPDVADLIGGVTPELVHGDLHGAHLFADPERGEVTGLIDFNDMYAGDFRYGLVQLHLSTFGADRGLLAAALDAAGWPVSGTFPEEMLAYSFLHDFEVFEGPLPDLTGIANLTELAHVLWDVSEPGAG
ncbi:phosphotransferase family protein [Nonomuraea zeae]|uniref:Aminoglycoside phosphotransferase family protein n=1 Tax=Nonomuraea zeae TaxID=1642303 RepID=A0A5S4G8S0_9ACTN|nr:aminoglycoside phosphotransferase family protein [Nonomuraea zeae]TMR29333.1 aminoglycoside phosphotransferase family protein [Nonomuraea zeae]